MYPRGMWVLTVEKEPIKKRGSKNVYGFQDIIILV